MESELERFHKQNTNLELNIEELKLKLKATEKEMYQERQKVLKLSLLFYRVGFVNTRQLDSTEGSCCRY